MAWTTINSKTNSKANSLYTQNKNNAQSAEQSAQIQTLTQQNQNLQKQMSDFQKQISDLAAANAAQSVNKNVSTPTINKTAVKQVTSNASPGNSLLSNLKALSDIQQVNVNEAPTLQARQTSNYTAQPQQTTTRNNITGTVGGGSGWNSNLVAIGRMINKDRIGNASGNQQQPQSQQQNFAQPTQQSVQPNSSNGYYQPTNLQEGYSSNYLQELAAQQIDPLNDAYQEALRKASADYNRLGLRGSGFELGNKYGSQNDSITSAYLDKVADVYRDVALKGAEAEREDRYRQAEQNEANRQNWAQFEQAQAQYDNDSALNRWKALTDLEQSENQLSEQARQYDNNAAMNQWNALNELAKWDAERSDNARQFDANYGLEAAKLASDEWLNQLKLQQEANNLQAQLEQQANLQNAENALKAQELTENAKASYIQSLLNYYGANNTVLKDSNGTDSLGAYLKSLLYNK